MTLKRNFVLSLGLGVAGGLVAYALAWGLYATHSELGMDPRNAWTIAAWAAPLVFMGSLIYFGLRSAPRR